MSSGYIEPAGGTSSPSSGTAVGSKPIRALLKVLRNVDIVAEPDFGSTFIPRLKTPFEILSSSLRLQNPAQTFYTNIESAALLANQTIKIPIITATESSVKKDEVVLLKQAQSLEGKTFPTYYDVTETAAPANPAAGTLRIYANSTTHELTQRDSTGAEKKVSDGTGGGGGGAPETASYLTLGTNATLTAERVLTASTRVTITDGGPGSTATLDVGTGSIVDSQIGNHTSTKISITNKSQLNSAIVYTDADNVMGDHYMDFGDIAVPANPASGIIRLFNNTSTGELSVRKSGGTTVSLESGGSGGAPTTAQYLTLATDGTLTNERVLTASTRVTITDAGAGSTATLDVGSGSIVDAYIGSHTSTKISITAKGQLNSAIVYTDQANSMGDFDTTFKDNRLRINNPADTFSYTIIAAAIGANRNLTLPLLTGNDTAVAEAFSQTLTNKTIAAGSNTISGIADTNISSHTSTKITITAKGQLNSAILYSDVDNALGSHYYSLTEIAQPANPAAGTLRIWADSTTHELSQVDSAGTVKKFTDGSGGGGGAPATSQYVTLATDATLTAERVLTGSTRVTVTDAGAGSTVTLDVGSGSIVDSYIGSHTSTKISITAKGQLNSAIVYNDQANSFGDFAQTFKDNQLKINNPADTFAYTIVAAAIGANRNLTLPLLTGNDTAVSEAFSQTLTNKTIAAGSNTISGIVDANIDAHTSSKITITTKGQLNSSIAYVDQANVFSDNDQSFRSARLRVANPANTFFYNFTAAAIAANRIINLPLLTATDTMAVLDFAQTFTNKTIAAGSNTITGLVDANISAHTTTKITTTSKSLLNSSIVYTDQANTYGAFDQLFPTSRLRVGDSDASHSYAIAGSNLAANRTITLPLLNSDDTAVMEAFAATLLNKTISGSSNTITNIGDSAISAHTSTKITITAKGQLNSSILYSDVDNALGSHYVDITERAAPSNPSAGVLRIYANSTTHELTQRDSTGVEKKFSDGSGGGGITASSTDTLTNKTISRTTNILPYTSPTKYSVYQDGGAVKVANNEDGSVNSYATLGPAINAVLADTSQPSCEVASGTYNLASDFSAWVIVPKFKFYTKGLVIINVPQGYAGRVFSIQNSAADVYYVEIDGATAIWDEQGTQTNDWIWLGISPTGNKAVHNCKFRNTEVWRATVPLYLKTTDNSWINQNTFENIYGTACKYLTTFDFVGTYTQDWSGCNGNRFVNVSMQATGADPTEHYPQALGGIIGVNGDYNTFEDCNVWDLAAANSSAVSMSITSVSRGTRIDGGILTHRFFDDQGTGTIITDYWKGIHNKGPTTLAGTNTLSGATTISGNLTVSGTANFTNTAGLTAKYLGITTPAIASNGEDLFSFTVADASGDSFVLTNSSSVDGTFCPLFRSTQNSTAVGTGTIGLYFEAMVKASTDTAGANWCNAVSGRRLDGNPMTTRGLFAVTNKFDTEYGFYPTYLDMVDNFIEMTEIAAPANPAAGKLRMWADSTSHEWSQKNSSGTVVKMSDGSGGGGAPTGAQYLTLATDGTLTSERVATASSRVTITDAGAGSTATFDIGSGSIVDAYIGSHTSTKISITAKGQLNSNIVYTDQANTWGAFNQIFPTSRLLIGDSDASHQYVIAGGNLTGANRTITLPALTGNDVAVTEAFSQTLTNKTLTSPVISTISNTGTLTLPTSTTTLVGRDTTDNLSNKTMYGAAWRVVSKSSDVTAAADELIIPVSASGANRTITLPAASSSLGKIYVFQKSDSSTNTVTIQRAGSDTINGATTFVLTSQYQTVTLFCDTTSSWATNPNSSERTGKAVASGNGSQTAFTISHGLGATPSNVFVDCSSHAIARTFTVDSTTITVTFSSAPSSGTNNVIIYWRVVA